MDFLASVKSTGDFAKTLSAYGPFALIAFFLLIGFGVAARQVNQAPKENRQLFKRVFIFQWGLVAGLIVFAMVVWYRTNVSPYYVMTGTIENLGSDETIYSDDLFLRTIAAAGDFTIYEWKIIKDRKLADGEKVDFIVRSVQSAAMPPHQQIVVKPSFYDQNAKVRIKWRKSDLRAVYLDTNEPLPQSGESISASPGLEAPSWFRMPSVWAQNKPAYSAVQSAAGAANPIFREAEIRRLAADGVQSIESIKKLLSERDPIVSSTAIFALNAMKVEAKNQIHDGHLLGDAVRPMVLAMGSGDDAIRREALRCINWYDPSAVLPLARGLLKSKASSDRELGAAILKTYGREDALAVLRDARINETDPNVVGQIMGATQVVQNLSVVSKMRVSQGAAVSPKLKAALDLAYSLKERKVPFKWGGKSEAEGFDTSGFVAYVLGRAGALQNPEKHWSGSLRQAFKPVNPPGVGDLIFYEAGYVTLFLGNQTCIGMTPSGILTMPVEFGPKILAYGKVNY